jgi:hypothetical protein
MSEEDPEKELVYFLSQDAIKRQHDSAIQDKMVAISHIHERSAPTAQNPPHLFKDLCEYVVMLEGYIDIIEVIMDSPTTMGEEGKKEYAIVTKDALLFKFFLPLLGTQEIKIRNHGLSMAVN